MYYTHLHKEVRYDGLITIFSPVFLRLLRITHSTQYAFVWDQDKIEAGILEGWMILIYYN